MNKDKEKQKEKQESEGRAGFFEKSCYRFLYPVLVVLDECLDRRLVVTFLSLVMVVIMHRHRNQGLLLSELGGYLKAASHAPAGTKRISNLLHAPGWAAEIVESYLWVQAEERVDAIRGTGKTVLAIWDESVMEKPESLKLEGLCAVISSKAKRLKRIKPGYFNPPGGKPICVPGYHWLQVLVLGMEGPITVAKMRWWSTRGDQATQQREVEAEVMHEASQTWGQKVIHVWDRGFAGAPWLSVALVHCARFIMRWPKGYHLLDERGQERKAWEITRGKRSWEHRLLWDARRRCQRKVGIFACPLFDKDHHQPLWLVVARPGSGREPWYLLTNEPIHTPVDAWQVVLAYARRWNIEMSIRFDKCELAFESLRVHKWETQLRLLSIATLAFAFLLSILPDAEITNWLLRRWCHRTGKWRLKVKTPLYRLRSALSRLWLAYPPPLLAELNSG
jgi:hypothetical protein